MCNAAYLCDAAWLSFTRSAVLPANLTDNGSSGGGEVHVHACMYELYGIPTLLLLVVRVFVSRCVKLAKTTLLQQNCLMSLI